MFVNIILYATSGVKYISMMRSLEDMLSVEEWKKRIVMYMTARSGGYQSYRASGKGEIFRNFGANIDPNADIAFLELLQEKIMLHINSGLKSYYILDFVDKKEAVRLILRGETEKGKLELVQPDESETIDLKLIFTKSADPKLLHRGNYYYYVKENDETFWVVLQKTQINTPAYRIVLGSEKDENSRICRIWKTTAEIGRTNTGLVIRKQVEDRNQKACGNNRLPSKAAFDIFVHKKLLSEVSKKGRTITYRLNKLDFELH